MTVDPHVPAQWTPAPWTPPPPAPVTRKTSVIVSVLVTAVVFAVLCSGLGFTGGYAAGYFGERPRNSAAVPGSTASPSAPAPAVGPSTPLTSRSPAPIPVGNGTALRSRLAPHDAVTTYPIDDSTNGLETVDQLAKGSADLLAQLQSWGCAGAAENEWLGADGVAVNTRLIQFRTAQGAGDYWNVADLRTRSSGLTDAWPITGVHNGWGYQNPTRDDNGWHDVGFLYADGPIVIQMPIYTYGPFDWPSEIALMQKQIDALAA